MKRFYILLLILILIPVFYFLQQWNKNHESIESLTSTAKIPRTNKINPTNSPNQPIKTSVFIPYWNTSSKSITIPSIPVPGLSYDPESVIYFGITPDGNGINKDDDGYKSVNEVNGIKILTVRMLDSDQNLKILTDKKWQDNIITDTIQIAHDNDYQGILLDFEISALPFQTLQNQITQFINTFSSSVHNTNQKPLSFGITIYGDTFYRARPFDLQKIEPSVDMFYIMAYDLHKAGGSPGPNFPLKGSEKYGTDLESSIEKFVAIIPPTKLSVIFGMYGYDWTVDENKRSIKTAKAKSLIDIKKEFLDNCSWKNCLDTRDEESTETEVDYIDDNLNYHIVWFEDEQSVAKKIEFLKTKGITNYSFWVNGYY